MSARGLEHHHRAGRVGRVAGDGVGDAAWDASERGQVDRDNYHQLLVRSELG